MKRLILIAALLFPSLAAMADEGMWMVHAISEALEKKMQERGLQLSAGEIYNADAPGATVADAIVSLGFYCTASVISDEGLLITNHHCAYSDLFDLSTPEKDYLEDGYWAFHRQEEIPLQGKAVYFLKRVLDVTDEVYALRDSLQKAGVPFGSRRISSLMERKYADKTGLEASLDAMWAGEKYYLALYQTYTDIRLVGAPPVSVAAFGGNEDNWEWPQHKGDFALYRIYDHGEPLHSPWHLRVSQNGYREGDYAMVLGYPARTDRYSSSYKVDYLTRVERPVTNRIRGNQMEIVRKWMDADPSVRAKYSDWFFSLSNVQEMQEGEVQCVKRFGVVDEKRQQEKNLPADILQGLSDEYAATEEIERQKAFYRETIVRGMRITPTMLRMSNAKDDEQRMALYKRDIDALDPRVEKDLIAYALEEYFGNLPAEVVGPRQDSLRKAFSGDFKALAVHLWENPYTLMDFVTEVKIGDFNARERHTGDLTELTRSYTRALYHEREARGVVQYPDANSTMRLTYGVVSALEPWDAVYTSWYSSTRGLREKYDPAQHDYALPADFVTALDRYDGPVNFLTDNDISGGNSGSPVLNARGEVIGLAFDGNKESLASDVSYTPDYNKCVCVDIRYVLWILRDYVGLDRVVEEIER
ncbi:MAG: S46 family peptidase [Bacteroidales bacterium]|nr:S46 family peptidase [Bacteroidales bacterium]